MRSQDLTANKVDWLTIGLYLVLTVMGIFNIYSSAFNPEKPLIYDQSQEYGKQITWWGISIVLAGIILLLDGNFIRNMAYPIYIFCIFLLILVLLIGKEVHGAKAWFGVGSFGVQPSEFAKVAISLALAKYLSTANINIGKKSPPVLFRWTDALGFLYGIIFGPFIWIIRVLGFTGEHAKIGMFIVIPAALIMLQPDTGTVLVFVGFVFMMYREGLSGNILLFIFMVIVLGVLTLMLKDTTFNFPFISKPMEAKFGIITILAILAFLVFIVGWNAAGKRNRKIITFLVILVFCFSSGLVLGVDYAFKHIAKHQRERIEITLGLKEDPDGKGYNIDRAQSAIGSGKLTGKGYKKATLANKNQKHVPMASTDFIFCTLSEEWGFMGSFLIVALFVFLMIRFIIIAERQRSPFTRIYGYCVVCLFLMHFMINIGMAIGLAPVIGIPLPFFSYGGSSLLAFTILVFILIRLDAERLDVLR